MVHVLASVIRIGEANYNVHVFWSGGTVLFDLNAWRLLLAEVFGTATRYYMHDEEEAKLWEDLGLTESPKLKEPTPSITFEVGGLVLVDRGFLCRLIHFFSPSDDGANLSQTLARLERHCIFHHRQIFHPTELPKPKQRLGTMVS